MTGPGDSQGGLPPFTMVTRRRGKAGHGRVSEAAEDGNGTIGEPKTPPQQRETVSAPATPTPLRSNPILLLGTPSAHQRPAKPDQPSTTATNRLATTVIDEARQATDYFKCLQNLAARLDDLVAPIRERFPTEAEHVLETLSTALRNCCRPSHSGSTTKPQSYAEALKRAGSGGMIRKAGRTAPTERLPPKEPPLLKEQALSKGRPLPKERIVAPAAQKDTRIMVRLSQEHPLRAAGSYAVRQKVNALATAHGLFKDVIPVSSGYALIPISSPAQPTTPAILEDIRRHLDATVVEAQGDWTTFLLDFVPRQLEEIPGLPGGSTEVTPDMIINEIRLQTGLQPSKIAWTKRCQDTPLAEGTAMVYLPTVSVQGTRMPKRIRLFGHATVLRPLRKALSIPVCENCFGSHSSKSCRRQPKCIQCGELRHDENCSKPPRCLNCRGPHQSTALDCPARPVVKNGIRSFLNRVQRIAIRAAGSRAWTAAHTAQAPTTKSPVPLDPPASPNHGLTPQTNSTPLRNAGQT